MLLTQRQPAHTLTYGMVMYPCPTPATYAITAGLKYTGQHTHNVPHHLPIHASCFHLQSAHPLSYVYPLGCKLGKLVSQADDKLCAPLNNMCRAMALDRSRLSMLKPCNQAQDIQQVPQTKAAPAA